MVACRLRGRHATFVPQMLPAIFWCAVSWPHSARTACLLVPRAQAHAPAQAHTLCQRGNTHTLAHTQRPRTHMHVCARAHSTHSLQGHSTCAQCQQSVRLRARRPVPAPPQAQPSIGPRAPPELWHPPPRDGHPPPEPGAAASAREWCRRCCARAATMGCAAAAPGWGPPRVGPGGSQAAMHGQPAVAPVQMCGRRCRFSNVQTSEARMAGLRVGGARVRRGWD